ncbi:nucleotidyltransferase domain-containing protein [uncultured Aquitalea sp.]|uniref:nucleotidyltransferase domain-containing protein n=1 Tax=uncultured Aquitalea sp. TaxID=540272 RepID=UPI0025DAEEE4|nr:nucleotidyltransferase domain-containing protein [uncultured Aquitalea sp.]
MGQDDVLKQLCAHLRAIGVHTALLYGSRANDTAGPDSDYDILAFANQDRVVRDARVVAGAFLDVFIYPETMLADPPEELIRAVGGKVLFQRLAEGDGLLARLQAMQAAPLPVLPEDEVQAMKAWAWKMLARSRRQDAEGLYRRVWLLTALLEDYFTLKRMRYPGPKKALRCLELAEPEVFASYLTALQPGADEQDLERLVRMVAGESPEVDG